MHYLRKRRIAPYKNYRALPGVRMMKHERIEGNLTRIAKKEICMSIDPKIWEFISQCFGKFKTEFDGQDILAWLGAISRASDLVWTNKENFSGCRFIKRKEDLSKKIGAMYKYYSNLFLDNTKM